MVAGAGVETVIRGADRLEANPGDIDMANTSTPAGGRATEAGMAFQAAVGTWFAAHLVGEAPVGRRFGASETARPTHVQFETGEFLDDVALRSSDGGMVLVQCKTRPALSSSADSALADTVAQLVSLATARLGNIRGGPDLDLTTAVLAVARDAPASLDDLERACRYFDHGARWEDAAGRLNKDQRRALDVFSTHARSAWQALASTAATSEDLAALCRMFRVVRFDVEPDGTDWRDAARLLGARLLGREDAGAAALDALSQVVRRLVRTGAPADRDGLVRALRTAGVEDTRHPRFDRDLARLRDVSAAEVTRLDRHCRLPIGPGVPIPRECASALRDAADGGSLLVVGEPGAGKTGVLVALARERLGGAAPFVFLSVDRLAGVSTADDLRTELGLDRPLLEVLAAWPGTAPGILVIDALDASRGGTSEGVFANLVEDALPRLGDRWSILASIRTFDLRNGRRFRALMTGAPPSPDFAEPGLDGVRHFRVPRLTDGETGSLANAHPPLGRLLGSAPPSMRDLLRNVFNLSLAAELVGRGVPADSIGRMTTQSELIDRYEDERLDSTRLRNAARDVVEVMVERRRIAVPMAAVRNDALDEVLATGVLACAGERVAFAHHVLFDHAAGRFHLDWSDPARMLAQVSDAPDIGLLLGPALRFALERVWEDDDRGRAGTWGLVVAAGGADDLDPVVASVVLRSVAERVALPTDVLGLRAILRRDDDDGRLGPTMSRLARFVGMSVAEAGGLAAGAATAWAMVARDAVAGGRADRADGTGVLLDALSGRVDLSGPDVAMAFGEAARTLLRIAWSLPVGSGGSAARAIRLVCASYATDVDASRALLGRILEEPRLSQHAHEEAPWLAEGVPTIASVDPDFATRVYEVLFGRAPPQDGESWLGGHASRILPLLSTRRQDHQHVLWLLGRALPAFLRVAPREATHAVSAAAVGMAENGRRRPSASVRDLTLTDLSLRIREDDLSLQDWRDASRGGGEGDVLAAYASFLRDCPPEAFRRCVEAARAGETATSVWARLLGIGAERPGVADDLLWPVASATAFLDLRGSSRDAISFLAAALPGRSTDERRALEAAVVERCGSTDEGEARRGRSLAARLLSVVDEGDVATTTLRELRAELSTAGALAGNRPLVSIRVSSRPSGDVTDDLLRGSGVDLGRGPDKAAREAARPLGDLLRGRPADAGPEHVAELWRLASRVVATLDGMAGRDPHPETLHAAWGDVANAFERIAQAEAYDPGTSGQPALSTMLDLGDRLALSPYPEARDEASALMSWGSWDVRVYAASGLVALATRFGDRDPTVVARLPPFLSDPVPATRLQVAQSIDRLWRVDRATASDMFATVARDEADVGVLGFFVGGPLLNLSAIEPSLCEAWATAVHDRPRQDAGGGDARRSDTWEEAFGHLAARLWVGGGRPTAEGWIVAWTSDLDACEGRLWSLLHAMRGALFGRYVTGTSEAGEAQDRARGVLHSVVVTAARAVGLARPHLAGADDRRAWAERLYQVGEKLLDHACNQVYFGAGAFRGRAGGEPPGLATDEAKRLFLDEYSATLDAMAAAGTSRALHHLIEVYEFVATAAPEAAFDKVCDVVIGPGAIEGYRFESLGSDVLVRLVRRYLADHRSAFEDPARRGRLVSVLERFSSAGWPEALRLLYDLPDLLR